MLMTISPALIISFISLLVNTIFFIAVLFKKNNDILLVKASVTLVSNMVNYYLTLFILGVITTITEWKEIRATTMEKILYTFTFPVFIATYIPIAIVALFKKVEWQPIVHTIVVKNS